MRCLCYSIFITMLFIRPFYAKAQVPVAQEEKVSAAEVYFNNEIKQDAHLYTGKEYYRYESGIKGFPFFITDQMQAGEICYDGIVYKDVSMLFDAVKQVVIINRYQQNARMQLLTEKIKYIMLNGHRFETVARAEGNSENISKGLYDMIFKGKASILVKRIKKIKKGLHPEDPYAFTEEDEYYIRNVKVLYEVSNINGVVQALDDKKELIKSFIKKNKLKFKRNIEQDLIITASHYSTLN